GPDITLGACSALADLAEKDCAPLLARLIDMHLAEEPVPGRYRVHDLLRLFAHERAVDEVPEDERTGAVERLVGWYLHSACAARVALDPHLPPLEPPPAGFAAATAEFDDKATALAWYDVERPNLVAASLSAHGHDLNEHGWKLPIALFPFFDRRKFFEDWVATHKSGAECAHLAGDAEAEGKVLCNLGSAYRPMRRFDEAVECYERAGELFRTTGWRVGEGKVLGNLAATYADADQVPEAVTSGLAALDVFRELDDAWGQALCLSNLGNAYARLGAFDDAMRMQAEALDLFRGLEDTRGAGRAVNGLGTALARLGRPEDALVHVKESVDMFAEVGDHHEQAYALVDLAGVHTALSQPAQAAHCLRTAGELFTMLGEHWMVAELRPKLEAAEAGT
ncbi:MAG: tetratricopeptide repeat protein, partial [Actinocrinis sp.]